MLSSTVAADLYVRAFVFLRGKAEPFKPGTTFCFAGRLDVGGGIAGGRGRRTRTRFSAGFTPGDLERGGMLEIRSAWSVIILDNMRRLAGSRHFV